MTPALVEYPCFESEFFLRLRGRLAEYMRDFVFDLGLDPRRFDRFDRFDRFGDAERFLDAMIFIYLKKIFNNFR